MPIRYAELMGEITGLPPLPIAEMGPPVLTPLRKPLSEIIRRNAFDAPF